MIGDFQIALIGIVIAVILIVFGYNRWQESKHRRNVERAFADDRPDVLFDAPKLDATASNNQRKEPQIGDLHGADADAYRDADAEEGASAAPTPSAAKAYTSQATNTPLPAAKPASAMNAWCRTSTANNMPSR